MEKNEVIEIVKQFTEYMLNTANAIGEESSFSFFTGKKEKVSEKDVLAIAEKLAITLRNKID